jgi:hypothetical protein
MLALDLPPPGDVVAPPYVLACLLTARCAVPSAEETVTAAVGFPCRIPPPVASRDARQSCGIRWLSAYGVVRR